MTQSETLSRWYELCPEVQAGILDKYRYWNVDGVDWWDCCEDQLKDEMMALGFRVDTVYFSVYGGQGDGAYFEGRVADWPLFLKAVGIDSELLAKHFGEDHTIYKVERRGRYYHENNTEFSNDMHLPLPPDEELQNNETWLFQYTTGCELRDAVLVNELSKFDEEDLDEKFQDFLKAKMREYHRTLEQEYDYLVTDEAVLEALEANGRLDDIINEALQNHEHQ